MVAAGEAGQPIDGCHITKPEVLKIATTLPHHYWVQTAMNETVLGTFNDAEGRDLVKVVNRNVNKEQAAPVRFGRPVDAVEKSDKQRGDWVNLALVDATQFDKRDDWARLIALRRRGRNCVELTLSPADGELPWTRWADAT